MNKGIVLPNDKYPIQVSKQQETINDLTSIVNQLQKHNQNFIIAKRITKERKNLVVFRTLDGTEPVAFMETLERRDINTPSIMRYHIVKKYNNKGEW